MAEYTPGTGKRKTAIAQVKLFSEAGPILVNGKPYQEAFPRWLHQQHILKPFVVTGTTDQFRAAIKVTGGGLSGQAEAIRHGIARSLAKLNEAFKKPLRQAGLLTRDARIKERKKYGLKRARKAPQYTKR